MIGTHSARSAAPFRMGRALITEIPMSAISRRQFVQSAAVTVAGASLFASRRSLADPLGLPIACQTWPVRQAIAKDFPGTLRQLAAAGFRSIEMCSPVGYDDSGFGGLKKYSGAQLRRIINDAGLTCVSSHFSMDELRKDQPARIAWAKDLGLTQMLVASLGGPKHPTMDDVKRAADEYNRIGHRAYDLLFQPLDPLAVKFQFQVSTIADGFDAADYFMKYPGLFISMHVQGWNAKTKTIVAVGQGTLDWKRIFTAAKTGGIRNYFVEMALPLMQASVPYLQHLQV